MGLNDRKKVHGQICHCESNLLSLHQYYQGIRSIMYGTKLNILLVVHILMKDWYPLKHFREDLLH